jgi:extracellular factor (EF) 3-hydroxypalmitic acid methyl ester biosynthesis protein
MTLAGGLVVATNVDVFNPCRRWMELAVDWHLIYRNAEAMRRLIPPTIPPDAAVIRSDHSGVNVFLEIRKPIHA